jgi:hypothetical protein
MFDGLFLVSIVGACVQAIKEACEPVVVAKNEIQYPEPHRDPESGKIMIENCKLYYEDIDKYGASQAQKWVKQGKYNLSPEDFEKEKERIREKYKRSHNY